MLQTPGETWDMASLDTRANRMPGDTSTIRKYSMEKWTPCARELTSTEVPSLGINNAESATECSRERTLEEGRYSGCSAYN